MMEILTVDRETLIQKLLNSGVWHHRYGDDICWQETNPDLIDFVNSKEEKAKGSQLEYVIPPLTYEEAKELGLIPPNQRLDLMIYLAEKDAARKRATVNAPTFEDLGLTAVNFDDDLEQKSFEQAVKGEHHPLREAIDRLKKKIIKQK